MTTLTRILLIDDAPHDRAAVEAALAGSNLTYQLVTAHDADTGLREAERESFDCVLLDCHLKGVDVTEFLARLTSPDGGRQAVIALMNHSDQDEVLTLLRAGALDWISRREADPHDFARAIRYAKARRGFVVELQAAREDAEEKSRALDLLNRQKTLILSIIAHDLRNPFQVLLGMSELLAEGAPTSDPEAIARRAAGVHEAASQAHGLLESLFAWANLHMQTRGATATPLDVEGLFQDCVAAMQETADGKGVRLQTLDAGLTVLAQEDAVAAILRNLVVNAIKFTPSGGSVTLAAEQHSDRVALGVSDTGVGMTEAQTAGLFQLENRSTSAGTDGERGAGLGLLLCRDLAEWIGGSLEVDSRLGEGATFRLWLPAAA